MVGAVGHAVGREIRIHNSDFVTVSHGCQHEEQLRSQKWVDILQHSRLLIQRSRSAEPTVESTLHREDRDVDLGAVAEKQGDLSERSVRDHVSAT